MKQSEYARLIKIIEKRKLTDTELLYDWNSGVDFRLKTYLFNISDEQTKPDLDKKKIHEIIGRRIIDRYSGVGVVIVTPSFLEDYERFCSINMWKNVIVDNARTVYKHVPDNNFFGLIKDNIIPFVKTSDNYCTIDLQIMGNEAKLWENVVSGRKSLEQYLTEFVSVV
jgi:hypothetical protein